MIIVMQKYASQEAIDTVVSLIRKRGLNEHVSRGIERTIIGAVGDERVFEVREFELLPEVEKAMRVVHEWRMVSREVKSDDTLIKVRRAVFGDGAPLQILSCAECKQDSGSAVDAFFLDPFFISRDPYQNTTYDHSVESLAQNLIIAHQQNKPVIVRLRDVRQLERVLDLGVDILYLGGELMANRLLQTEVGRLNMPVIVCKDKHHVLHDWLLAAERIILGGNHHLIFCEAGTLSLENTLAARLDVEAIAQIRALSYLPVIANVCRLGNKHVPSSLLAQIAITAGACGVIQKTY